MKILTIDHTTVIKNDEVVVATAENVDLNTINIDDLRTDYDVLAKLYADAVAKQTPESAAKYVKHKQRVLDWVNVD